MRKCYNCSEKIEDTFTIECVNCGAILCKKCIYLSDNLCPYCKSEMGDNEKSRR